MYLRNKRGDINIQYLGIAAISITILAAVAAVALIITNRWESLEAAISSLGNF